MGHRSGIASWVGGNNVIADSGGKKVRMIGEYVRLVVAPKTCRGTITDRRIRQGNLELLFHPDERFDQRISDLWVLEAEVEMCARPTDAEVKVVNLLEKRGH